VTASAGATLAVMRRRGLVVTGIAAAVFVLAAARARADEPAAPVSAERLRAAAEEFDRGRRAYLGKDFDVAATHFENAYRDAPRAETLRLAIRARREARQLARAATLAAVAADRYAADAATAQLAKETLDEAAPALHEVAIECRPECAVAADGRVVSQSDAQSHRLFLEPGPHEIATSFKQGSASRAFDARAGGRDVLSFEPPRAPAVAPARAPTSPAHDDTPAGQVRGRGGGRPLSPAVFFVATGVTAVLGGVTVASGIAATQDPGTDAVRRACAGKDETCPEYQEGKSAETRTNVLLGATIGAAVVTAVIGVLFTQWSPRVIAAAAPLPGGAGAFVTARF